MKETLLSLLREEKEMKLKGGLYHKTQIEFAYNSNRIEGSRLTEDQTRCIFETNTILNESEEPLRVDDIVEMMNHFKSFDYLLEHGNEKLTEDMIKEYHRILKSGTSDEKRDWFRAGDYKLRPNTVGDRETAKPSKVGEEMRELLHWYEVKEEITLEDIIEFHFRFECIHPFQDGNGRVGRLIMFMECLKNDIVPFIIGEQHKAYYYRGLSTYQSEPGYLRGTCLSAQDAYGKYMDYFFPEEGMRQMFQQ